MATTTEINPASDGPWTCAKCTETFPSWQGFLRHGRITKHFTISAATRLARKKYADLKFHQTHPDYKTNTARDRARKTAQPVKPTVRNSANAELCWVSMQTFEDGYLMILRPRSSDDTEVFYAVPAMLKFNMPKPKVTDAT